MQPANPQQPVYAPPQLTPEQVEALRRSNQRKLTWALVMLLGPTLLLVLSIAVYVATRFISATTGTDGEFESSQAHVVVNVILFLVGMIASVTWLPGIITGVILLATRKPVPPQFNS